MKLLAGLFAIAIAGCAAQPSKEMAEFDRYMKETYPLAGKSIKWSAYYEGLFSRMVAAHGPSDMLALVNEAIRDANDFEAGRMTEEQFAEKRRSYAVRQTALREEQSSRNEAARALGQAAAAAQLATAAQLLQADSPAPQPTPVASYSVPGTLQSQTIDGTGRRCKYSNGAITTMAVTALCPYYAR